MMNVVSKGFFKISIIKNVLLLLMAIQCSGVVYGQKFNAGKMQETLHKAVAAAYPASVRMWGFDTVTRQQMSAQFSGVVVSKNGYILTAAHTTVPGKTYKVMFSDKRECIAMALGKIELAENKTRPDVALMKIITSGTWPHAQMGSSATIKENEPCISIAYPESLYQPLPMVRFGRISVVENQLGFVQSTCIMEPGDSGGPLFDYKGRVIALHSAIDVSEDINYEIPVDLYKKYWTALLEPKVYQALPAIVNPVKPDAEASHILSVPQLKNLSNAFKSESSKLKAACVKVRSTVNGNDETVSGTLVSVSNTANADGPFQTLVVSKSSMVGSEPVIMQGVKAIKAAIIARSRAEDLVLLVPATALANGIKLSLSSTNTLTYSQPGKFLLSPLTDTAVVVSVLGSGLFQLPRLSSLGYLGAAIAYREGPMLLTVVQPGSPADRAGLQVGDEVLRINSTNMTKPEDYGGELQKYWPGDTIAFKVKRRDSVLMQNIILVPRPQMAVNHPAEMFAGGKSNRRDGFDSVFVHDARLKPAQCGGPVFDKAGHFYGVNIARYSRASTVVLPTPVVQQFIRQAWPDVIKASVPVAKHSSLSLIN